MKTKRPLLAVAFCLLLGCSLLTAVSAEESTDKVYYDEYDDYPEFEEDYLESVLDEDMTQKKYTSHFSIPAIAAGAAVGAAAAFIFFRKIYKAPLPEPFFRQPVAKHTTTEKTDTKIDQDINSGR